MLRFLPPLVLLIAGGGMLSGCARLDTYNRPYTWHPTGANIANIAAQVAHPQDLVVGQGSDLMDAAALVPGIRAADMGTTGASSSAGSSGAAGASATGASPTGASASSGASGGTP